MTCPARTGITIPEYRPIPPDRERELCARAQAGDAGARDEMAEGSLALVASIAARYLRPGGRFGMDDLVGWGSIGLLKAIDGFDASYGTAFSTYAHPKIQQSIHRHVLEQSSLVRVPLHVHEYRRLRARGALPPDVEEAQAGAIEAGDRALRLRGGMGGMAGDGEDFDPIASIAGPAAREIHDPECFEEHVPALMRTLPARQRQVVALRFGIGTGVPRTLEEVGEALGVSPERARQVEAKALARLRRGAERLALARAGRKPAPRLSPRPASPESMPPPTEEPPVIVVPESTEAASPRPPSRKSAYRGVSWHKGQATWRVTVCTPGGVKYGGNFNDEEAAARAYDRKAVALLGGRAKLNFPDAPPPSPPPASPGVVASPASLDDPPPPLAPPRPLRPTCAPAVAPAIDREVAAMGEVVSALSGLDAAQLARVLAYAMSRFGPGPGGAA